MTKEQLQNLYIILYAVPFIAGIVGWIYYYLTLDTADKNLYNLFLMVSKDPIFFLIGLFGVLFATLLDAKSSGERIENIIEKIEKIALALIIIEILEAVFVANFDLSRIFLLIIGGKYAIILPLMLITYSYMIPLGNMRLSRPSITSAMMILAIILMISAPAYDFYAYVTKGVVRRYDEFVVIFFIGLILLIVSNYYSLRGKRSQRVKKKP
ncbi:MAG: hypothetical protein ABSB40_06700 [Nitrososphaeria archaeon]